MPTKKTELQISPEVMLWKENKIKECRMEFSCGGDSMNDYSFNFFNSKGKEIVCEELKDFFEDEVFRRVEFYEASDGHYIGEFGEVIITLNDDEDDFEYDKLSKSEWSESYSETIPIGITKSEMSFLKEKVAGMNGGDGEKNINYKIDCIISDDEEEMIDNILNRIDEACSEYEFEGQSSGEPEDFYRWTTNENSDELEFDENNIFVQTTRSFIETREESNW
jgi:hypothetical protein